MKNFRIRKAIVAGAAGASLIALAVPSFTGAASAANLPVPSCFTGSNTLPEGHSYHVDGTALAGYSVDLPSCPGASYSVVIIGQANQALGWTTTSATADFWNPTDTNHQSPQPDPAVTGSTSVSNNGQTVTITFTGDGLAQTFNIGGFTSGYTPTCVTMIAITAVGPTTVAQSNPEAVCSGGSGGGGFW